MSKTLVKIVAYNSRSRPHFFKGSAKTSKFWRHGGIANPCPQENHGQNLSPLRPHPYRISLSNQSVSRDLEQLTTTKLT